MSTLPDRVIQTTQSQSIGRRVVAVVLPILVWLAFTSNASALSTVSPAPLDTTTPTVDTTATTTTATTTTATVDTTATTTTATVDTTATTTTATVDTTPTTADTTPTVDTT